MKRHIPCRSEWIIFLAMAAVCTIVVTLSPQRDTAMFACTLPVFLVASLLGFRRNQTLRLADVVEDADEAETVE